MPVKGSGIEGKCIWGTRGKSYGKKQRRGHAATSGSMGRDMISFSLPTFSLWGAVSFRKMGVGQDTGAQRGPVVNSVTRMHTNCPADEYTGT